MKMGRRLSSIAWRINSTHEILVNYAADQEGGDQIGFADIPNDETIDVPFGPANDPLADRKHLVLTFPTDRVWIGGNSEITDDSSYPQQGRRSGGNNYALPPALFRYSSRKQFLRGQYKTMAILDKVPVFAVVAGNFEVVSSLELA